MRHSRNDNRKSKSTATLVEKEAGKPASTAVRHSFYVRRNGLTGRFSYVAKTLYGKAFGLVTKSSSVRSMYRQSDVKRIEANSVTITIDNSLSNFLQDPFILENNKLADKKLSKKRTNL